MISSVSVDLAVTFSLPGDPASSSSICRSKIQLRYKLSRCEHERRHFRTSTNLHGNKFADELDAMLLHVVSGPVGHVLVKSSQQNGAHHDGDVQPEAGQEAAALQGHVGSPDDQSLPGTVGQREEVITGREKKKGGGGVQSY